MKYLLPDRKLQVLSMLLVSLTTGMFFAAAQTPSEIAAADQSYRQLAEQNIEKFRKGDAVIQVLGPHGEPLPGVGVSIDQQTHDFLFGNLLFESTGEDGPPPNVSQQALFNERFLELFNLGVLPFYWQDYERQPGKPRWEDFQATIAWAQAHNITLKGHPLVWHTGLGAPRWLKQFTPEQQETLLAARVLDTTAGYAHQVKLWDVVNEPLHKPAFIYSNDYPVPISAIADYCEKAFREAHTGNPEATLILNEFDIVSNIFSEAKLAGGASPREQYVQLIREMDRGGVPAFDVGLQSHEPEFDWLKPKDFWDTINLIAATGHAVHITELMFPSNGQPITGGWRTGIWTREAQAEHAEQMYTLGFGNPAVSSINYWGLSDRDIWRDQGGLLDEKYEPKPIYDRLRYLIKDKWMIKNLELKTDESGQVRFRGFYGEYRVRVVARDAEQSYTFHLGKGELKVFKLKVVQAGPTVP